MPDLSLHDLAYLVKVYNAVKSDNPPELSSICPECDETVEIDDIHHTTLNTRIPEYWGEKDHWGQPNPYDMDDDSRPLVLIGCEGYHIVQF